MYILISIYTWTFYIGNKHGKSVFCSYNQQTLHLQLDLNPPQCKSSPAHEACNQRQDREWWQKAAQQEDETTKEFQGAKSSKGKGEGQGQEGKEGYAKC